MTKKLNVFDFLKNIAPIEKECVKMISSCLTYYSNWDRTNYFWTQKSSWDNKYYYEHYADDIGLERVEELFDEYVEVFKNYVTIDRNASGDGRYYAAVFK